jgi:hypothetical protein
MLCIYDPISNILFGASFDGIKVSVKVCLVKTTSHLKCCMCMESIFVSTTATNVSEVPTSFGFHREDQTVGRHLIACCVMFIRHGNSEGNFTTFFYQLYHVLKLFFMLKIFKFKVLNF